MILDSGICTVFKKVDVSQPGGMPTFELKLKTKACFGMLDFATEQEWPTEGREETEVAARIRILQDRTITNHDAVVLEEVDAGTQSMTAEELHEAFNVAVLEVTRAYHGHDDENGEPITDLTLKAVRV